MGNQSFRRGFTAAERRSNAADFPKKTVRIAIPFSAGGAPDVLPAVEAHVTKPLLASGHSSLARPGPFRELDDRAIWIANIELAANKDAMLAIFLFENLNAFCGEKRLGGLVLVRIDFERVVSTLRHYPR